MKNPEKVTVHSLYTNKEINLGNKNHLAFKGDVCFIPSLPFAGELQA